MLRPLWRSNGAAFAAHGRKMSNMNRAAFGMGSRAMSTQSSGDTNPPTALATLYLEDGTTLTGRSFGSHEAVEGEVC